MDNMDVLDNIETITYKHGDTVKYSFSMINIDGVYSVESGIEFNLQHTTVVVTYKNGVCHSINGQPAIIVYVMDNCIMRFIWCHEGKIHRESGLPAYITRWHKAQYLNNIEITFSSKKNTNMMLSIDDQYND